jgi:hypothetical protein
MCPKNKEIAEMDTPPIWGLPRAEVGARYVRMATTPIEAYPEGCVMTMRSFLTSCAAGLAHYPISSKKVAVLTGLTMLVSGAGIVSANANTTTPAVININTFEGDVNNNILNFLKFSLPGTLTGVTFGLDYSLFTLDNLLSVTASVTVNGTMLFSINASGSPLPHPLQVSPPQPVTLTSVSDLSFVSGIAGSTFPVNLSIDTDCGGTTGACSGGAGLPLLASPTHSILPRLVFPAPSPVLAFPV